MEVQYLDCDELDIECQIRGIVGTISSRITSLTEIVRKEISGEVECPTEPHFNAARFPKRELSTCADKLKKIHTAMENLIQISDTVNPIKLGELATGVEHVSGRLHRISKTKTGNTLAAAQNLLETCDKLLGCFNDLRSKQSTIPDVEKSLKDLIILIPDGVEDEGEIVSSNARSHKDNLPVMKPVVGDRGISNSLETNNYTPQTTTTATEVKILNPEQINSIVDVLLTKLNLPTAINPHINAGMHSSTIISPTNIQTPPVFNTALPPPIHNNHPKQTIDLHSLMTQPNTSAVSESYLKKNGRLEIYKWDISFSGECGEIPVERFIYRVESLASSNGINTEFLVRNLNVLLKGKAREWYWIFMERERNVSWESLRCAMTHRFQDRRTDADIRQALERRKQRVKETFLDFYNDILSMSLPLQNPMTELETISLLVRNMRPGLQSNFAGQTFNDISTLVNRSIAVEDTWNRIGWIPELVYQSRRQINELEGNADFSEVTPNQVNFSELPNNYDSLCAVSWPNTSTSNMNNTRRNFCWNCESNTHFFKNCIHPISHKFCFGCGAKDVIKVNCRTCRNARPMGNYSRDVRNIGALRSQNQLSDIPKPDLMESATNTDPEFYKLLQRKKDP